MVHDSSRKKELSRELDSYIASRRQGDDTKMANETVANMESPQVVETVDEDVVMTPKKSWFSSMMEKVFGPEESIQAMPNGSASHEMSITEVKDDMKALASISLAVIKQLPERTLREFKESSDFTRFKEILKKHSIIK